MPTIFITRAIPDAGPEALKAAGFTVKSYKDAPIPRADLLKSVKGCDALLSLLTDNIDEEVLAAAGPSLKVIANYAVGFDNVDLAAAKKRNIVVTKVQDVRVEQTLAQRMFHVGDLSIETAGETSRLTISMIDSPQEVADHLLDASHEGEQKDKGKKA